MINLKCRTEYSFRNVFGPIQRVVAADSGPALGIADTGTWGHVPFFNACKKAGKKPILGAEIAVVESLERKRQPVNYMTFIAKNDDGLKELYEIIGVAYGNFYYIPRLNYNLVGDYVSNNLIILSGTAPINMDLVNNCSSIYIEINPSNKVWAHHAIKQFPHERLVITSDNYYPRPTDKLVYDLLTGSNAVKRTGIMHIASESELKIELPFVPQCAFDKSEQLAATINLQTLPHAPMVKFKEQCDLRKMCLDGFAKKGLEPTIKYMERMERELQLIKDKNFTDYFLVVADMINEAKKSMLVGPSRGSSAGSLVCYLIGITEVDPIVHDLIFERFIDITREDLPDIDVDFPDVKREEVIKYLEKKYSKECVAHIGTVSRYKPKSAIGDIAKELDIPAWETKAVKDAIIERSGGDARAAFCIKDTFETLDVGKEFIEKYPMMKVVEEIENHARHSGVHAAGILVCNDPVNHYCGVDTREGTAMIDKKDAEKLNLLKIDILGLRTLSVLEETLDQIGMDYEELYRLPLEDKAAFAVFNNMTLAGIFQFEGYALQSLTRQMTIEKFDDIVAITSLARPGPLHCGGATDFVERRTGRSEIEYLDPSVIPYTKETYGSVVYQEQVLQISREVGNLSWEDTNQLRKALSKSLGEEFFNKYKIKFLKGASENGVEEAAADHIWKHMCTFGSWAFNKSHAVSYGLISYWCAYLKAHHPLEFAVACLNNAKDDDQSVKILRELSKEGYQYKPFDPLKSGLRWTADDGVLIGGFINVKGIGIKTAKDIIKRRNNGEALTSGQISKLDSGITPFNDIFEGERRFGDMYNNPSNYNIQSGNIEYIENIQKNGIYVFLGKLQDKNLRDLNEYGNVVKRGGRLVKRNNLFLNITVEDDTDSIICTISRWDYNKIGKPVVNDGAIGDWYLIKGEIKNDWRKIHILKMRKLT